MVVRLDYNYFLSMNAEETDFNDVEDLVFKEKENVSFGTGFGSVESAIGNLVLVSNKYGFVIAAIKKGKYTSTNTENTRK